MTQKHRWTYEEDKYCCKLVLEQYVLDGDGTDTASFLRRLAQDLPEIPTASLKMKLQNIKQLLAQREIPNTLELKPLCNYSRQNERAMADALRELDRQSTGG